MNKTRTQDTLLFVEVIVRHGGTADVARRLMRYARTHGRLAETACNRELTPREEKQDGLTERHISELAATVGAAAKFSGDPRGYTVKLAWKDGAHNTWGGASEGWGVPQ